MIGKFMSPTQLEFRRFQAAEFTGLTEPGYGKVAVDFLVLPYGATRSPLCTETRTATTDPVSARRFRRYWAVIGPFAGYIMRQWLTLAKQHAEHRYQRFALAAAGHEDHVVVSGRFAITWAGDGAQNGLSRRPRPDARTGGLPGCWPGRALM